MKAMPYSKGGQRARLIIAHKYCSELAPLSCKRMRKRYVTWTSASVDVCGFCLDITLTKLSLEDLGHIPQNCEISAYYFLRRVDIKLYAKSQTWRF